MTTTTGLVQIPTACRIFGNGCLSWVSCFLNVRHLLFFRRLTLQLVELIITEWQIQVDFELFSRPDII